MTSIRTPESVGIPKDAIQAMVHRLEADKIPLHSLAISRYGHLVFTKDFQPYDSKDLHRMYSVTKSLTSLAIGQLAHEGLLSLDDPIMDYFQDLLPEKVHPFLAEMTIRHMLVMKTCYKSTTYKINPSTNWVSSFFTTVPDHRPGTEFNYDTSASHTLGALVERLTGKNILDYLRPICLNPIGFSQDAYILKDPFGASLSGSGLMARPSDLMALGQLLLNEGIHENQQRLSKSYLKEATSFQSDTSIKGTFQETQKGYGYQFWCNREGGFNCFGMEGQWIICLPKYQMVIVTTGGIKGAAAKNQAIHDALYEEVIQHLSPGE